MPDNQVVLLLPIARNSRRTRVLSHSVSPLAILRTTGRAAGVAVTSLMMLGLMAQLSGFAMATDYTTTQTTSLLDGDTIATTGAWTAGYGVWSKAGLTLELPGNNTITTSGDNARGLTADSTNTPGSNINAVGTTITVGGSGAVAAHVTRGSVMTLHNVTATANGANGNALFVDIENTANVTGSTFVSAQNNSIEVNGFGATLTMDASSIIANGDNAYGLRISDGSAVTVTGATTITTTGANSTAVWSNSLGVDPGGTTPEIGAGVSISTSGTGSYGVIGTGGAGRGLQVGAATVITQGDNADGAQPMHGGTVILNGTHVTTHGANAVAAAAGDSTVYNNASITITGATLTTTGDGSNAVQIYGHNDITMDNATVIRTTGVGSHAISIEGGATKTYGMDADLAYDISVTGKDSAVFHAVDNYSVLTVSGVTLNPDAALGVDTWTAIAEKGGTVDFENIVSGINGVWAKGSDAANTGTIILGGATAGTTPASQIRARVDDFGILDISGVGDATTFTIASLEGTGDKAIVKLGTKNLTISGDAKTSYAGTFEGTGAFIRSGTVGSTTLTGDNSAYTSAVSVTGGSLYVDGQIGGAATVTGGTLGGSGTIGGDVSVAAGGNLAGRQGQVLTIQGNLALDAGSTTTVALGAPEEATASGLFNVAGDVTLAGKLNVTDLGGFGPGLYRLIDYGGTLSDNGMTINNVPDGLDATQMSIQTSVASEVNLINRSGADLNFWDGSNMANHGNGAIDGGTGTWKKGETNWTDTDGTLHGNWSDGQFAMFTGTAGTVTVDNSGGDIVVDGMQFAVDGYRVEGDAVTLQDGEAIIRVGVGNGSGKGMSATIASELKGTGSLNKKDYGTLILTADNSYAGGTTISEGTLQLGDGGTAGSVQGDILNNATLAVNRSDAYKLSGKISGSGALAQNGTGTLIKDCCGGNVQLCAPLIKDLMPCCEPESAKQ